MDHRLGYQYAEREAEPDTDYELREAVRQPDQSHTGQSGGYGDVGEYSHRSHGGRPVQQDEGKDRGAPEQYQERRPCRV